MIFFIDFDGDIQMKLRTIILFYVGTCPLLMTGSPPGAERKLVNPKTNKGCPPFTVNRTSA